MNPLSIEPGADDAPSTASSSRGSAEDPQKLLLNAEIAPRTATRREALLLLMCAYAICSLDRLNISTAQLQMGGELGISVADFGLAAGIFFASYSTLQIPFQQLTARVGAHRTLPVMLVAWGVASAACALVHDVGSLAALRLVLGVTESGFYPGCVFYLTRTMPADSLSEAMAVYSVGGAVTGGMLAIANGAIMDGTDGLLGFSGWRWLFLLEALPAPILGVVLRLRLPPAPAAGSATGVLGAAGPAAPPLPLGAALRRAAVRGATWTFVAQNFICQMLTYAQIFFTALLWRARLPHWRLWQLSLILAPPQLATVALALKLGRWADRRPRRRFRVVWTTSAITAFGLVLCGGSMLAAAAAPDHEATLAWASLALLTAATASLGAGYATFWPCHNAATPPQLQPVCIALTSAIATLGGFVGPFLLGALHDGLGPKCPHASQEDCVAHYGWGLLLLGAAGLVWTAVTCVCGVRLGINTPTV